MLQRLYFPFLKTTCCLISCSHQRDVGCIILFFKFCEMDESGRDENVSAWTSYQVGDFLIKTGFDQEIVDRFISIFCFSLKDAYGNAHLHNCFVINVGEEIDGSVFPNLTSEALLKMEVNIGPKKKILNILESNTVTDASKKSAAIATNSEGLNESTPPSQISPTDIETEKQNDNSEICTFKYRYWLFDNHFGRSPTTLLEHFPRMCDCLNGALVVFENNVF